MNFEDFEQNQPDPTRAVQARINELEDALREQGWALAESEKQSIKLHKLSELKQSTL
jgi:hypothetical protein